MNNLIDESPLFVLGCPRSGTTLVGNLIERSKWGKAVETHFIMKYHALAKPLKLQDKRQFLGLVSKIVAERPVMQWKIDWDLDDLFNKIECKTFSNIVNELCMERSRRLGYTAWADKTPHYSFDVLKIAKLFPTAKFLFVYRDGRDVATSLLGRSWGPNNIWTCANYWKSSCQSLVDAEKRLDSSLVHSVYYEKLLATPLLELERLYRFLQMPDPTSLAIEKQQTIKSSNVLKWKSEMSPGGIHLFERTAGDTLEVLGYPTSHKYIPINSLSRIFYRTHDKILWAKFMFKQNIVDGIRIKYFGAEPFNE